MVKGGEAMKRKIWDYKIMTKINYFRPDKKGLV